MEFIFAAGAVAVTPPALFAVEKASNRVDDLNALATNRIAELTDCIDAYRQPHRAPKKLSDKKSESTLSLGDQLLGLADVVDCLVRQRANELLVGGPASRFQQHGVETTERSKVHHCAGTGSTGDDLSDCESDGHSRCMSTPTGSASGSSASSEEDLNKYLFRPARSVRFALPQPTDSPLFDSRAII